MSSRKLLALILASLSVWWVWIHAGSQPFHSKTQRTNMLLGRIERYVKSDHDLLSLLFHSIRGVQDKGVRFDTILRQIDSQGLLFLEMADEDGNILDRWHKPIYVKAIEIGDPKLSKIVIWSEGLNGINEGGSNDDLVVWIGSDRADG